MGVIGRQSGAWDVVNRELGAGESAVWIGKPSPIRMESKQLGPVLLGFILAITYGNITPFSADFAYFWPYSMFACTLLWPLYAHVRALYTAYAITNKRVMIIKKHAFGRAVKSWSKRDFGRITYVESKSGSGDLIFAQAGPSRFLAVNVGFFGIPQVRQAHALLMRAFSLDLKLHDPTLVPIEVHKR